MVARGAGGLSLELEQAEQVHKHCGEVPDDAKHSEQPRNGGHEGGAGCESNESQQYHL